MSSSLDAEEDVPRATEPVVGVQIESWIEETVKSNTELDPEPESIEMELFGDEADNGEEHFYRELVTETWSYKWLIASLRSKSLLQYPSDNVQSAIGKYVRQKLYSLDFNRISRYRKPDACRVRFTINWKLCSFLNAQKYDCATSEAITTALVVTGDATNAQGCTCAQYMCQTWPLSGKALLDSIYPAFAIPGREHYCRYYHLTIDYSTSLINLQPACQTVQKLP